MSSLSYLPRKVCSFAASPDPHTTIHSLFPEGWKGPPFLEVVVEPVGGWSGHHCPTHSPPFSKPLVRWGEASLALESGVGGVLGHGEANFSVSCLKVRGGKTRREKSYRLGRGGGPGKAGVGAPYSHPYYPPPNFPGEGRLLGVGV